MPEIKNTIKVKVKKTDILLPQFLYYALEHAYQSGKFKPLQSGSVKKTLSLGRIKELKFNMGTPENIPFRNLISTGIVEIGIDLVDFDFEIQRVGDNSGKPLLKNESLTESYVSYVSAYRGGLKEVIQAQILINYIENNP